MVFPPLSCVVFSFRAQIADHVKARVQDIRRLVIWGNHSNTQFPDTRFVEVNKDGAWTPVTKVPHDPKWLQETLIPIVQKRGAEVIAARKLSSAMSAAQAAADHMRDWFHGTKKVHDHSLYNLNHKQTRGFSISV